jgi:hypothetical protein
MYRLLALNKQSRKGLQKLRSGQFFPLFTPMYPVKSQAVNP